MASDARVRGLTSCGIVLSNEILNAMVRSSAFFIKKSRTIALDPCERLRYTPRPNCDSASQQHHVRDAAFSASLATLAAARARPAWGTGDTGGYCLSASRSSPTAGLAGEGEREMNRFTLTFVVLAATGGCMGLDRDPTMIDIDNPRRTTYRPYEAPQGSWNGRSTQSTGQSYSYDNNWRTPGYVSGTSTSASRSTASKSGTGSTSSTGSTATASASKPSTSKESDAGSEVLKQATYTVAKAKPQSDNDTSAETKAKPETNTKAKPETNAKTSPAKMPAEVVEAKSAPVNLGVLRLLNTKRVTFHYEVKDPGTSGAAVLELWGTKDMRSWKKYDTIARTPQSFMVDVKDEGLYGFTMIARGKNDPMKDRPPQPGEPPQVWVAVDLTKPVVQLIGAELNIMTQSPALVIRWTAKDKSFGPKPITLMYSERLEGPWVPIVANVENSGHFEWTMPNCVPPNVYVRVQATDMMGNIGMAQTSLLHIPGRTTLTATRGEPTTAEPRLAAVPPPPALEVIRPVAATVPAPNVSILSVDAD